MDITSYLVPVQRSVTKEKDKKDMDVFTDGSCLTNPGPGGWAFCAGSHEAAGHSQYTTNQEMELQAMYEALSYVHAQHVTANIYSDSQYVIQGLTSWCAQWQRRDFTVTRAGKPLQHADLWRATYALYQSARATVHWIKGHAGHAGNERADKLARVAATHGACTSRNHASNMPISKSRVTGAKGAKGAKGGDRVIN
jgi:ribonuclease HI